MTIDLSQFNSLCEPKQKRIVSEDKDSQRGSNKNPAQHIAINASEHPVRKYKIDGCVLNDGNKCDFMVLNDELKNAYLIELKGSYSDLEKAIKQLDESWQQLKSTLSGYTFLFRIVYRKGSSTHNVKGSRVRRWENEHGGKTKEGYKITVIKQKTLEETIS